MEYPTLPVPAIVEAEKFFCPFGCQGDECDEKGYCAHLVGFTTDRETVEPLTELLVWSDRKERWVPTGHLTVNGAHLEQLQDDDVLVNPIVRDKMPRTNQEYDKYSWVSFRVYTNNPDRIPVIIEKKAKLGPRSKAGSFELKHRKTMLEQQLRAPSPDNDIEVNPRKAPRTKANEKVQKEVVAKLEKKSKRISTDATKTDSPPTDPVEI